MNSDYLYMQRCLELAMNGLSYVSPNPMVGCVIVHQGKIIGESYHKNYGGPHAEANAIASVSDHSLLSEATLYVNLEPCAHYGKTPPCANLIVKKGIKKIVIGCEDPFPEVAGKGIGILRDAGCDVKTGVLYEESRNLNKRFFTCHEKKRPYIILKWAQTSDGFIDIIREADAEARPTWISSERLRLLVHKWRSEEAAIMAGTNTVLMDNPSLDIRNWHGRKPIRIILDRNCSLPLSLKVFDNTQKTIIFNALTDKTKDLCQWIRIPYDGDILIHIIDKLYHMNILSVFVEGGRYLLQSIIDAGLWDEARVFTGPQQFGKGCKAPVIIGTTPSEVILGKDEFLWFENKGQ